VFGACSVARFDGRWHSVVMTVTLRDAGDREKLKELVAREKNARQRDRYRCVLLAMDDLEGNEIAQCVGRSPRFVDEWAGRYRNGGIEALVQKKQPGRKPKLTAEQEKKLKARLDAGALESDEVCSLRGKDICKIIQKEFGVVHTLGGIYDVLKRMGYSSLMPRPRHRKNDPAAMEVFEKDAPFLSRE
jgi:transposase